LSDLVFLVNPASANGSTGKRWPEIAHQAAAAGLDGDALISTRAGELADLTAQAVEGGARRLVAVGGDGTVFEVVNGLMRRGPHPDVELAIVPRGTGTDFVRTFRIPTKLTRALEVARDGRLQTVDLGRNDRSRHRRGQAPTDSI